MPRPDIDIVRQRLEAARHNLLDTSLRNRLVNYRTPKAIGVEVIGEHPAEVFRILVTENKAMMFTGKPDRGEGETETPLFENDSVDEPSPVDIYDSRLNTNETKTRLQNRLLKTWRDAQSSLEEQGVNILFLALGILEWYESDTSQELRRAPLILIPVLLERDRGFQFRIRYEGTEVGENLSLAAKLDLEFRVKLPSLPDADALDVRAYFEAIKQSVASMPRWRVDEQAIVLGFFSYAKYLMFKDLEGLQWPEQAKPWMHEILGALLEGGFDEDQHGISEEDHLDQHRPIVEVHEVCDADSSQVLAILEAKAGQSMIIEGPPGTGKSQTSTNLIAEAIGAGKKVLFCSEKRAALDVVWRNLEKAGLHAACLELHSNKTSKKDFYTRLEQTVNLGMPQTHRLQATVERLQQTRDKLNAYCEAVHQTIDGRGLAPLYAMGKLLLLGEEPQGLVRPTFALMERWIQTDFLGRRDLVEKIQAKIREIGPPFENPFWGSGLRLLLPHDKPTLLSHITECESRIEQARTASQSLADRLGLPLPETVQQAVLIGRSALRVLSAPPLEGIKVSAITWKRQEKALRAAIAKGKRWFELHSDYAPILKSDAWGEAVQMDREILERYGEKWWRVLNGKYRATIEQLRALCLRKLPDAYSDRLAIVDAILECQEIQKNLTSATPICEAHWGNQWHGEHSDWEMLATILDWVLALHLDVDAGILPPAILRILEQPQAKEGLDHQSAQVSATAIAADESLGLLLQLLRAESSLQPFPTMKFIEQIARTAAWQDNFALLEDLIGFNLLRDEARDQGIEPVAELASTWEASGQHLVQAFDRTWFEGVLREVMLSRPALGRFDRQDLEGDVKTFRELDQLMLELNKTKVALKHWEQVPRHSAGGSLGSLQRQFALTRGHKSIRKIMADAGVAIQAIKPVFMMSPLSVALYLPPTGPQFDLVIFDEASQIKPEDSFGPIIRSRQAIVVGDSKQMPPTSFFDKLTQADEEWDEDAVELNVTRDLESVLALMDSKIPPRSRRRRDLRWHYRSLHDSLIACSNRLFYHDRLVVFPTADRRCHEFGLVFHHYPHTVYGRGGSKKNLEEAKIVAQAVLEHVRGNPAWTVGVAAFSGSQQEAILDELERLRANEPAFAEFDRQHPHEPLFVKNLENVQGDERDVILISVGYGRDADGFPSMNFGPLNKEGGERRLNVLISRARKRCEVFSNLCANDIRIGETQAKGVHALRTFLHFAETGELDLPAATGIEPMSPFEEAVIAALSAKGYVIRPQVGSAGFFVDIGVCDPENHDRFILGIECDGAKYHSARSARDRDRLRQEVLERRGWRIHRIWSTDWWLHRDRELRRTFEAIEQAIAGRGSPRPSEPPPTQPANIINRQKPAHPRQQVFPNTYTFASPRIRLGRRQLREVPSHTMADWIQEVVQEESPVHFEEVVRRIREEAGLERAGEAIRDAIRQGAQYAADQGKIVWDGDFLWHECVHPVSIRNRADFPSTQKRLELVHTAEIKAVITQVVRDSFGISRQDIGVSAARLLGFERATDGMRERIDGLIDELLRKQVLCEKNGRLQLCNS